MYVPFPFGTSPNSRVPLTGWPCAPGDQIVVNFHRLPGTYSLAITAMSSSWSTFPHPNP